MSAVFWSDTLPTEPHPHLISITHVNVQTNNANVLIGGLFDIDKPGTGDVGFFSQSQFSVHSRMVSVHLHVQSHAFYPVVHVRV